MVGRIKLGGARSPRKKTTRQLLAPSEALDWPSVRRFGPGTDQTTVHSGIIVLLAGDLLRNAFLVGWRVVLLALETTTHRRDGEGRDGASVHDDAGNDRFGAVHQSRLYMASSRGIRPSRPSGPQASTAADPVP